MHVIQAAIPLFFLCIVLELLWSQCTGRRIARLNDALSDLSCGVLSQLAGIFDKALTLGAFIWVQDHFRLQRAFAVVAEWPNRSIFLRGEGAPPWAVDGAALGAWVAAFVLVDFCYYWSHRMSHEVNVLWAGHVVHHQSEEYNLSVALRQASIGKAMTWVFYLPLALIGMPWQLFVVGHGLNLIYQFIIHTRAVGTMGRLTEWVLNTPSHHRVHHGVNPKYQDKNYGGVFIVFDRWFGTFQREEEEPVYGITKPLRSWNPLWANLHVFVQMARDIRRTPAWGDRLRSVFGRPGGRPAALGGPERPPEVSRETFEKFDPPVPAPLAAYGFAQFATALVAALFILRAAAQGLNAGLAAATFFVIVALAGVAGVFERAKWARPLETARLVAIGVACAILALTGGASTLLTWGGVAFAGLSLLVLWRYRAALTEVELAPIM
ncbi:MAG: sterol desaturase family protein [Gemmatimonadota bacterium]